MTSLFGCLVSIIFIAFFALMAFAGAVIDTLRRIFGLGGSNSYNQQQRQQQQRQQQQRQQQQRHQNYRQEQHTSRQKPKVFADDEGEYVDFEEVKR